MKQLLCIAFIALIFSNLLFAAPRQPEISYSADNELVKALDRVYSKKQIYPLPDLKARNFFLKKKILVDVYTGDILENLDNERINICEHFTYESVDGSATLFLYKHHILVKRTEKKRKIMYGIHLWVRAKGQLGSDLKSLTYCDNEGEYYFPHKYGDGVFEIIFGNKI